MSDDRRTTGETVRREVLGDAHVTRANEAATAFDAPFQALITEGAWGTVWADDAIPRRERSMLTLALLAALGNEGEIPMHVRAAARTGASRSDIAQAFLHVAIYAGVPRANRAFAIARRTFAEMDTAEASPSGAAPDVASGDPDLERRLALMEAEAREADA